MAAQRWFDFHLHSSCSDGECSPGEVVSLAARAGLEGISITDHDTLDAYEKLSPDLARNGGPWILPGIEVSANLQGEEVHVLGYFAGGIHREHTNYVEEILELRRTRMVRIIRKLRERGLDVTLEDCRRKARGRVVAKSHVAEVLVEKRYVRRSHSAYRHLLGPEVAEPPGVNAEDATRTLARLGGCVIWAHPAERLFGEAVDVLVRAGLHGVEVIIPRRGPPERRRMAAEARRRGLLVTGGSDWHGHPGRREVGSFRVGEVDIEEFLRRIGR